MVTLILWPFSPLMAKEVEELPLPDVEFLEFLGSWETEDHQWIDPLIFSEDIEQEESPEKVQEGFKKKESDSLIKKKKEIEVKPLGGGKLE